ncbi:hypothetical protein FQN54_000701 [Arachnomyces sp. PD_36]|nr:hypothetical protein FQN54_000701 [Arachnomyces sp. PD_36]
MASPSIDYYKILEIPSTATQQQIRDAYKRAALKSHPDRVPADSPERGARTRKFQKINDAYYTLSDPTRRREYDDSRKFNFGAGTDTGDETADEEVPPTAGGFPWSSFGFGGGERASEPRERDSQQFGDMFEEMLREEGLAEEEEEAGRRRMRPTGHFWSLVGGLSGGALGFIIANFPGAMAGAVAGNRLGAVRDAKGKSVYEVFQQLPQQDRARLLSQLAARVFQSTMGAASGI